MAPREEAAAAVAAPRAGAVAAPHAEAAAVEAPRAEEAAVAAQVAAALQRAAPVAAAGLPSAAAWAFRRDQVLPWPAPSPAARFARATAQQSTASPSARSWRAATSRRFVMMVWIPGKFLAAVWQSTSGDQQIDVRPDCGGPRRRTSIYFCTRKVRIRHCSLRIQAIGFKPSYHIVPAGISDWPDSGRARARQIGDSGVGCRRGRARSLRSSHRKFVGRPARQFVRLRRLAGLLHRRRHLRLWTARRTFRRRLRRIARRRRRDLRAVRLASTSTPCGCRRDRAVCRWPRLPPSSHS